MQTLLSSQSGRLALSVLPDLGARVLQWTFDGQELLSGPSAHPDNWGATFWTSPQADWGWPPVVEVDSAPYRRLPSELPLELALTSAPARIAERHFRIEKRFRPAPSECIDTEYRIINLGEAPFSMASWEISRVPAGGLTFFPSGAQVLTPIPPHAELLLEEQDGVSFYDHGAFQTGSSRKVHADGQEGFLAHVFRGSASEDLLLLKLFLDSPPVRQAPGEGEVEIFANFDGRYVEVEVQGPCETIAPGGQSSFLVRTAIVPIRRELSDDWGALVDWARTEAARLR